MTPSEKPERSASQSEQNANLSTVSTRTVGASEQGTESASSADETRSDETGTAEGEGHSSDAESASSSSEAETVAATEAPPPWQRAAAAGLSTSTSSAPDSDQGTTERSAEAESVPEFPAADPRDDADTQTIPKQVQDQETVRTPRPSPDQNASAAQSARASVSSMGGGSRVSAAASSGSSARRPSSRGPRRASLQVKRVDPWSVLKLALVLSVALFFAWMIAVAVLYGVLDGMGVWEVLNGTFTDLAQPDDAPSEPLISAGRVFGVAAIIGGINIVLLTALATVGAFVYNVAADFAGGMEVTLSERE